MCDWNLAHPTFLKPMFQSFGIDTYFGDYGDDDFRERSATDHTEVPILQNPWAELLKLQTTPILPTADRIRRVNADKEPEETGVSDDSE